MSSRADGVARESCIEVVRLGGVRGWSGACGPVLRGSDRAGPADLVSESLSRLALVDWTREAEALVCGSTEQRSTRASIEKDALGQLHVMQGCAMPESPKESVVLLGCCCCVEAERVIALTSWRGLLCACAVFNFVPPVANEAGCNGAVTRHNALSSARELWRQARVLRVVLVGTRLLPTRHLVLVVLVVWLERE